MHPSNTHHPVVMMRMKTLLNFTPGKKIHADVGQMESCRSLSWRPGSRMATAAVAPDLLRPPSKPMPSAICFATRKLSFDMTTVLSLEFYRCVGSSPVSWRFHPMNVRRCAVFLLPSTIGRVAGNSAAGRPVIRTQASGSVGVFCRFRMGFICGNVATTLRPAVMPFFENLVNYVYAYFAQVMKASCGVPLLFAPPRTSWPRMARRVSGVLRPWFLLPRALVVCYIHS